MGMQTTEALATEPSSVVSKPTFASISAMSAPTMSSTTAYVAQQEFGEMPRPNLGHGTRVIAPRYENCCSGYSNQIQSSCVQSGSPNQHEQHLDGPPHHYGFDSLKRQSVFLADGSEHSLYALLEDYPLEQATPPVSHSAAENVPTSMQDGSGVFKEMLVYDVYEDVTAYHSSLHPTVDIMEVETEEIEVMVDSGKQIISHERPTDGIFSFTNEKKSDTGLLPVCFNNDSDNALSEEAADLKFSYAPVIHGDRSIKLTNERSTHNASTLCVHEETVQPRDPQTNVLVIHERRNGWDPGIHTFFSSTQTSDIHYFHETSILPKSGIPLLNGVLAARIQFGISKCFLPRQCNYRVPSRLMNPGIHFLWNPGILNQMDIMPEETAVPNLLRSGQEKFKLLIFIGKHVGSKQFWAQMLLHCHSWCTTASVFLRVQSCCLPIILDYLYSEPFKQLVCYCSIFSWTAVSLSTIVHMKLVLSAWKIVQEGRDVWDPGAATFHVRFMTADDATKLQCIDVYKSAMIQILVVKLGARNAPIFATAIMCFVAFDLRWTEMNAAVVLVQVVPYSKDTFVAKHMKTRQVQWDPGIIFTLYELWWLSKGTEYALRHLLSV